ncbi:hypothetical protein ACYTV0_02230, partial (plasmid) [Escherichia coli]
NMSLYWKAHYNCGWGMSGTPFLPGKSLRFHADIPHAYANPGKAIVTLHNLIHYPRPADK